MKFQKLVIMSKYIKSRDFFKHNKTGNKIKSHPIIICWKLNTPNNLGNILRIADNMACEKVIFVDDNPNFNERNIKKTAQISFDAMDWLFCSPKDFEKHLPRDYHRIAIETSEYSSDVYTSVLPEKSALFVGNEKVGLDKHILDTCKTCIYIPMKGHNKSMNVSHALTLVLGEWLSQNYYG